MRHRNALENPPLLVVCDLDRIIVHTHFTGTVSAAHEIPLESLGEARNAGFLFGIDNCLGSFLPMVGPWQLHGMEISSYAPDLAQMTVWIGWLQWIFSNNFGFPANAILRPLSENIRLMDAIVSDNGEPEWPAVDFIIGNPPLLGGKLRRETGDGYVNRIFATWRGRVPHEADLCCYGFEQARAHIAVGKCKRGGLLATQGIRGGANREVLKRIKESGGVFWAETRKPLKKGRNLRSGPASCCGAGAETDASQGSRLPRVSRRGERGPRLAGIFRFPCAAGWGNFGHAH